MPSWIRSLGLAVLTLVGLGLVVWLAGSHRAPESAPAAPESPAERTDLPAGGPTSPAPPSAGRDAIVEAAPEASSATETVEEPSAHAVLGALHVTVVSRETAGPLANVRVHASVEGMPEGRRSVHVPTRRGTEYEAPISDEEGCVTLSLPALRKIRVEAWSEDAGALRARCEVAPLAPQEGRDLTIELSTEPDLVFRAQLLSGARAVVNAPVLLRQAGWTLETAVTNGFGSFSFVTESWREPYLRIAARGFAPALVKLPPPADIETAEEFFGRTTGTTIDLDLGGTLALTIYDGAAPAGALPVVLRAAAEEILAGRGQEPWPCQETFEWTSVTEDNGRCLLSDLAVRAPLRLSVGGREMSVESFAPGEQRKLELSVTPAGELHGRIVDQHGIPLGDQGVELVLSSRAFTTPQQDRFKSSPAESATRRWGPLDDTVKSDAQGRFLFERVYEGDYLLRPVGSRLDGRRPAPKAFPVRVDPERPGEVELVVDCNLFVRGIVVEENDVKLEGVDLECRLAGAREPTETARSTADGAFELGPLERGTYELHATFAGNFERVSPVLVAPAGTDELLVRVSMPRPEGQIAGFVLDEEGQALDATVLLVEGSADWTAFGFLPPLLQRVQVVVAAHDPLAGLVGRTPGPGRPISVSGATRTAAVSGAFHFDEVPAGDFTVIAATERGYGLQQVRLDSRRGIVERVSVHVHDGAEVIVELPPSLLASSGEDAEWHLVLSRGGTKVEVTFQGGTVVRVPPGFYGVELSGDAAGWTDRKQLHLANGSRQRVLFFSPY
jgi:hypothetical protein